MSGVGKVRAYWMFIGGEWVGAGSAATYDVVSPASLGVVARVPRGGRVDALAAVDAARVAFDGGVWSGLAASERANVLLKLADRVEQSADFLALLETLQQGKPLRFSRDGDLPFAVDSIRFFASASRCLEGGVSGAGASCVRREPVGVVGVIAPWNYPLVWAVLGAVPALAAGNCVVLKPAGVTPLTALELAALMSEVGVPKGAVNVVTGPGAVVGEALVASPKVDAVTVTGEGVTGRRITELAAGTGKRVQLELGGKAPFIVFDDADLGAAAEGAVAGGFANCGQDCTAASRLYVQKPVYQSFLNLLVNRTGKLRLGNPESRDTDLGPLTSEDQRDRVEFMVRSGLGEGARLLTGGNRPKLPAPYDRGYYYEPTIFSDAEQQMRIVQQEIFGPVLTVLPFETEKDGVEKANDGVNRLVSSVWTRDTSKATRVATELRFDRVDVNNHLPLASKMSRGDNEKSVFRKDRKPYAFDAYTQVTVSHS